MKKRQLIRRPCANEGCPRPAAEGEQHCETCGMERSLYRRDSRRQERLLPAGPAR